MKLKDIFNNIFKPPRHINKVESDDQYCHSKLIWNSEENIIILLSYTEDYFGEIIELQDAIKNISALSSKIIYSSYDEKTDKKDENGNDIWIIHKKYYMLIGGSTSAFSHIYYYIHNLGNNVLNKITDEIVNNCSSKDFKTLIDDGILYGFKDNPEYDIYKRIGTIFYNDPDIILKRLPNGFTGKDLLQFIYINNDNYYAADLNVILKTDIINMTEEEFKSSKYFDIYTTLFKNPTVKKLSMLLEPLYKQPDDDSIPGDVSDETLDEIFRENYERFSAVADDSMYYEDIDEELGDDEEYENMREGGKIE